MKKVIYYLLLSICFSPITFAADIKGKVQTPSQEGIEYATVYVNETTRGTTTNTSGAFTLSDILPGKYTLTVSSVGYQSQTIPFSVSLKDKELQIDTIVLAPAVQHLDEVVVVGRGNGYAARKISPSIRLNEPLIDVPQNIQVVGPSMLADQQITSMSDGVIRNVSGVTRLEHWGDSYTRLNARGSRMAAFREGMNVTSNWGPLTEDMSYVERIEFVKGPAGFMMSNGEPSGIYNVVTKKPTGEKKGQASLTLGSYDFYRAAIDLDGRLDKQGKLLYRLNLMGQTKNSHRLYEYNNRYSIAPVISYQVNDRTLLTAEYALQYVHSSNTGSFYSFSPSGYATLPRDYSILEPGMEPTTILDHSLILNMQHHFNEQWKLTAQGAYMRYEKEGSSMWFQSVMENGDMIRTSNNGDALNEMKFGQVFVNGDVRTGAINHRILGGFDAGDKHAWYDWSQTFVLDSAGTYNVFDTNYKPGFPYYGYPHFDRTRSLKERANTTQITQSYVSLYVQDELGFFEDRLRLTLAGRFTHVKDNSYGTTVTNEKHFSPRAGLSFSFDPNTSVYALYDQSFSPQMGILRNGDKVKPITGNNIEVGAKRVWFEGQWNTTLSAYRILKDNETAADPNNTPDETYKVQVGQSTAKGVEIDLIGEILPHLNIIANYAYTDYKVTKAKDKNTPEGARLPGYAKHTFNVWFKYQFSKGCLRGFYLSAGQTSLIDRSTWGGLQDGKSTLPDYFRLDGAAGWKKDRLNITLNVYNLTDRYLYSGSLSSGVYYWQSEPPRNYRLSVTYNF